MGSVWLTIMGDQAVAVLHLQDRLQVHHLRQEARQAQGHLQGPMALMDRLALLRLRAHQVRLLMELLQALLQVLHRALVQAQAHLRAQDRLLAECTS